MNDPKSAAASGKRADASGKTSAPAPHAHEGSAAVERPERSPPTRPPEHKHGGGHGSDAAPRAAPASTPADASRSPAAAEHRASAPKSVKFAIITVSDTRGPDTDGGGETARERLEAAGHKVVMRRYVKDDENRIADVLQQMLTSNDVEAVVLTGGTGVSPRDVTPEAVRPQLEKVLPGFGEIFRMLSFEEIGAAAIMSRAVAGVSNGRPVYALPGSPAGVKLAIDRLIAPEVGHLVSVATHKPDAKAESVGEAGDKPAGDLDRDKP